jgi:hypothetical protein
MSSRWGTAVLIALSVAACRRVRSTSDVQASAALICRLALRRKAPPWACHGWPAHSAAEAAGSGGGCYGCSPRDAGRSWVAKQYRLLCKAAVSVFTRTGVVATCNNRRQITLWSNLWARPPGRRSSPEGSRQPGGATRTPTGPSRLASLSSGDGRSRRQSCASAVPIALPSATRRRFAAGAFSRHPWAPPGWRARPHSAFRGAARDCAAPPGTQEAHLPSRRRGNALVRWVVLVELERVIPQRLKG